MDLHTGEPYWRSLRPPAAAFPIAAGDLACEVVVIGGGVTGSVLGHLLLKEGLRTILIDKGQPGEGSTAASTGLLQHEIDVHLTRLIRLVGAQRAVHAYRRGLTAVDEIDQLTEEIDQRCGFSRRQSLYFTSGWCDLPELRREFDCRQEHKLPAEFLCRRQLAAISSIAAAGALLGDQDGQLDPYAFTHAVLDFAVGQGLIVHAGSEAQRIEEQNGQVVVHVPAGRIRAQHVVFATGYAAHHQLPQSPGNLQSTFALASQPLASFPGWPNGWLIWETARPYFYARQTEDGRALIGGADTAFENDHQRDALIERQTERLLQRCSRLFPDLRFEPSFAWAGTFAETKDGLAYIGRLPKKPRLYAALGYGGNGITFSMIAARLITDLIVGRPNADAPVFSFER
jgi:glycine/D-amino acid oxidase-like deaminating enzyme